MRKLIGSSDPTELGIFQAILTDNHIPTTIKNYYLQGGVGEIPPNEVRLEIWVLDDAAYDQALNLINDYKHGLKATTAWNCKKCGEKIAREFSLCWKCGSSKPVEKD